MSFNLVKTYADLLEIMHLNEPQRVDILRLIFNRDIKDNETLKLLGKIIRPIKKDGESSFETVFNHLIKEEIDVKDDDGRKYTKRVFEKDRAQRLHWIKYHLDKLRSDVEVFSLIERDKKKRVDVERTYVYDLKQEYVIVLQPQNSGMDYYLLSAYYLNQSWAPKNMKKKLKNKLPHVL